MQLSYDYAKDRALMCLRANYESHLRTKALLTLLNDIYEPRSATEKRTISYLACLVDKEFCGHSHRSHVSYIESHRGLLHMYGLKEFPQSRACTMWP